MKRKIAMLIMGILLIGIVSAGIASYLSNTITGDVEVEGPVFYASCDNSDFSSQLYKLLLNNYDSETCTKSFIDGTSNLWFISEQLEIESFYPARYDFTMYAKTNGGVSGQIVAELWTADNEGYPKTEICYINVPIPELTDSDFHLYTGSCTGDSLSLNENDRLAWKLSDGFNDITYEIYIDNGNSKIEVSPTP